MKNKLILFVPVLLGVLFVTLVLFSLLGKKESTSIFVPAPATFPFASGSLDKNYQRISNRKTLTEGDYQIRLKLIDQSRGSNSIISRTSDYQIEYLQPMNLFMIQIKNNATESTKKSSFDWLQSQGLSVEGVCNLPIMYYLTPEVSQYIQAHNLIFDPTPPGC